MTRGFTLIEVLITAAITAAMIGAFATFYASFTRLYAYEQATKGTNTAAGAVAESVEAEALPADHVLASHTFSEGTYASGASTLVLELPSVDASGAILSGEDDYAAFYLSGTSAYRVVDTDTGSARRAGVVKLGDNVTTLSFSYDSGDMSQVKEVTVDVIASTTSHGAPVAREADVTVRLRNI